MSAANLPPFTVRRESEFGSMDFTDYTKHSIDGIANQQGREVTFRVGFWGNGEGAWVRVDDLEIGCIDHWSIGSF